MTQLISTSLLSLDTVLNNLDRYKNNPSNMQRAMYEMLDETSGGVAQILDPTNPFVFLMEANVVTAVAGINEATSLMSKIYPALSQNVEDLYRHMSGPDYLNRFAVPSTGRFIVSLQVNDILNKMVWNEAEHAFKATIPRDTQFKVDIYTFTLLYPIDIRKYENGVVQISYDASIDSPIGSIASNQIKYQVRNDNSSVPWIFFDLDLHQFEITSSNFPIQLGQVFNQELPYKDQFYMGRAFYRNNSTNNLWVEMQTTHSDQVYDLLKPTAVFQVFENYVKASIPQTYLTTQQLTGEIRFDIYTTKGNLNIDLSNYSPQSFSMRLQAIDEERDLTVYSAAMANISYYGYSDSFVSGGTSAVDFLTLRDRTITNSNGPIEIPITPNQLQAKTQEAGFDLVKNVDVVTDRIYWAIQKLPKPTNDKLATSANIGIAPWSVSMSYLKTIDSVASNDLRCTVLSKNLYKSENGIVRILTNAEVTALKALPKVSLTAEINSNQYLYSPFYYVLDDTNNEFALRAYDLDYPKAANLSFESQNQTLQMPVNTGAYSFTKTPNGFRLAIQTLSGNFYKQLEDSTVSLQLAYYPVNENRLAYINATLASKTDDGERIWTVDLNTNYDIDSKDGLCITNARMFSDETLKTFIDLSQSFHLFHSTTSTTVGFVPDAADAMLGKFILPTGTVAGTHETLTLTTGKALKTLWCRSRSMPSGQDYRKYEFDVPLYYEQDVYEINPVTGSIVFFDTDGKVIYHKQHSVGDQVLDNAGLPVYKHRKGDVILDTDGNPEVINDITVVKNMDILFVDGRQYFVDDPAFVSYNAELVKVLSTWITEDIQNIQDRLMEQSHIYFHPKTNLGNVQVFTQDQGQDTIPSEQSLVLDLYVSEDVYKDDSLRGELEKNSIRTLDTLISDTVFNMSTTRDTLKTIYGDSVKAFNLVGVGGAKNYQYLRVANEQNRLCLKKVLSLQLNGKMIIKEDVTVNFYRVT